jgi:hypothetical protein
VNELALFAGAPMKTHWKSSEYAREKARQWRLDNPDRVQEYRAHNRRRSYLQEARRKYGISSERFAEMMTVQEESCATCRKPFSWDDKQTKPHIDHCHASGAVRGILCNRCNSVLGLVCDNKELLSALAGYLE